MLDSDLTPALCLVQCLIATAPTFPRDVMGRTLTEQGEEEDESRGKEPISSPMLILPFSQSLGQVRRQLLDETMLDSSVVYAFTPVYYNTR